MSWTDSERIFFSLSRAIRAAADGGLQKNSLEYQLLAEASERSGAAFTPTKFHMPFALLNKRDMATSDSSGSAYLAGDDHQAARDVLRESSLIARMGCEIITPSAVGQVTVPRVTSEQAAEWLSDENAAMTASQPSVGAVTLMPKHAAALVSLSHQILRQSDADALVSRHLTRSVGRLLDAAILAGSGSDGEPLGLSSTAGKAITGTDFNLDEALAAVEDVRDGGAEPTAWVMPPAVATTLGGRETVANTGRMVLTGGRIADIPVFASTSAAAASLHLGAWPQVVVAAWAGGVRVDVDPFSSFNTGHVLLRVQLLVDAAPIWPDVFAYTGSVS